MDTVYNNSSTGPFMQTFKFLSYSFMFIIYQEVKSSSAMVEGLDLLETILGKELFSKEVEVLKTDRGSEFIMQIDLKCIMLRPTEKDIESIKVIQKTVKGVHSYHNVQSQKIKKR